MTRVKRGVTSRKRHKKELKEAKGRRATRSKLLRRARESNLHAGKYAHRDRRTRKRDFRRLWITRINAASRAEGMPYGQLINGLDKANIVLDRKMLSEMAIHHPDAFRMVVEQAKAALG